MQYLKSILLVLFFISTGFSPIGNQVSELPFPWKAGLFGGAHLLAEPGELFVEIYAEVTSPRGDEHKIRIILAGPDRKVLEDQVISLTEQTGENPGLFAGRVVIKVNVTHRGVYMLSVIDKRDRYGVNTAWSMRTSAKSYVLETATGHRDERHVEPIVVLNDGRPADIGFIPREAAFDIEVEGLDPDNKMLLLFDDQERLVAEIPVVQEKRTAIREYLRGGRAIDTEGSASYTVSSGIPRGKGIWRLHIPEGRAYIHIDGVTRWERDDMFPNMCIWTPDPAAWFPLPENRYIITPYRRNIWKKPGATGEMLFRVHNNSSVKRKIFLEIEFPEQRWPVALSERHLLLEAGETKEIEVTYTLPDTGREWACYIRATPEDDPEVSTYSSLTVHAGENPAGNAIDLPLVIKPYEHENEQFGYLPDYPTDNQLYFDLENRPFVVTSNYLHREENGQWVATDISGAVTRCYPEYRTSGWSAITSKIAFDSDNDLYLLGVSGERVALLRSSDHGRSFTAWLLPESDRQGGNSWDIEQFSGHNIPDGPPPVVRLTRYQGDDSDLPIGRRDQSIRWRSLNHLDLIVGEKSADGRIRFNKPLLVTKSSLGSSMHSGIPSSVVSNGAKVHVVWGEATDPSVGRDEIPGVPAYVATYDRSSGELHKPVFMSFGPPPNDGHNTPSITMDSKGYLHILVGTHGRPFQYLKSVKPNDAYGGWTEAVRTSEEELRQTYVGLVCGADDALHVVFRLWRSGEEHLDGSLWAALAYQRKLPGEEWEDPKILVAPPLENYSIYYHRLTIDRRGDLVLSYDYWSTQWLYRNDQRGPVPAGSGRPGRGWGRAVLTSSDGGDTWKFR